MFSYKYSILSELKTIVPSILCYLGSGWFVYAGGGASSFLPNFLGPRLVRSRGTPMEPLGIWLPLPIVIMNGLGQPMPETMAGIRRLSNVTVHYP